MSTSPKSRPLQTLLNRLGAYEGQGINHENEVFQGRLTVSELPAKSGIEIEFVASELLSPGSQATPRIFHSERTWIALSEAEKLTLTSINSNNPRVVTHELRVAQPSTDFEMVLVFGSGDQNDRLRFREEITIELGPDPDEFNYRYSWGMPGGEFAPRSGLKMKRPKPVETAQSKANPALSIWHVAIEVTNLERALGYYHSKLGFGLIGMDESGGDTSKRQAFVTLRSGFTLELYELRNGCSSEARPSGPNHLAFEIQEIETYRALLESRGLTVSPLKEFDTGLKTFSTLDPDGMRLEFFHDRSLYDRLISG